MIKKFVISFAVLALAVASAKTYSVTLFETSVVAGTELKPGDYKVDVKDAKVVISNGKQSIEAPVKVETADKKFGSTSVRYTNGNGKLAIQEIRLGGTKQKLLFN